MKVLTLNGLGRDIWTLKPEDITNFARGFYIIAIIYFNEVTSLIKPIFYRVTRSYSAIYVLIVWKNNWTLILMHICL